MWRWVYLKAPSCHLWFISAKKFWCTIDSYVWVVLVKKKFHFKVSFQFLYKPEVDICHVLKNVPITENIHFLFYFISWPSMFSWTWMVCFRCSFRWAHEVYTWSLCLWAHDGCTQILCPLHGLVHNSRCPWWWIFFPWISR